MRQKTFWAHTPRGSKSHLWTAHHFNKDYVHSACGLVYGLMVPIVRVGGERCKNCERAIKE